MKFLRLTIFMTGSVHIINMYSNTNIRKTSDTVNEIFNKIKNGSSEMSNVSSEILNCTGKSSYGIDYFVSIT